jgi:beta-lactamase superfamily II metal-dependent hydrolase
MPNTTQKSLELRHLLTEALRRRSSEPPQETDKTIADLWIELQQLRSVEPRNVSEALALKELCKGHAYARDQLEPRARQVYDNLREISRDAGLNSHPGWGPDARALPPDATRLPQVRGVCRARITQWAVGQGGFWTTSGTYRNGAVHRRFDLVYDCGSSTAGAVTRALNNYHPASGSIDYLFISHLDADHTSGLERLLKKYRVKNVVMPLLSPAAVMLTAARLATANVLGKAGVMELLSDPGTYLTERHRVDRVFLVESAPENERADPQDARQIPINRGQIDEQFHDILTSNSTDRSSWNPYPKTVAVPYASSFLLVGADDREFWHLVPYVHPFEPLRVGQFMQHAYKLLDEEIEKGASINDAIKSILSSRRRRNDLKRFYRFVRYNHNCVSMSLFSGPLPDKGSISQFDTYTTSRDGSPHCTCHAAPQFGWMHTGDSTLANNTYRRAWLGRYRDLLRRVGVFVLPHHGSKHNFHAEIIETNPPDVALACASRENSYNHPAPTVRRIAKAHSTYQQVDERVETECRSHYSNWEIHR